MVEVAELARRLQKAKATSDTMTILDILEALQNIEVTKPILKATKIGHVVNKLRKYTADEGVQQTAKTLVAKWKRAVAKSPKTSEKASTGGEKAKQSPPAATEENKTAGGATNASSGGPSEPVNPDGVKVSDIEDCLTMTKSRNVVRRKVSQALTHSPVKYDYVAIAVEIETKLWFHHGQNLKRYSQQYRDICFNLRDKKNPDFKSRVLDGQVSSDEIVHMEAVQMASKAQAKARKDAAEYQKAAINLDKLRKASQKITEDYKCGKCGNTRCSYYQMQTRGADEPMTTFVTCLQCGQRWKD